MSKKGGYQIVSLKQPVDVALLELTNGKPILLTDIEIDGKKKKDIFVSQPSFVYDEGGNSYFVFDELVYGFQLKIYESDGSFELLEPEPVETPTEVEDVYTLNIQHIKLRDVDDNEWIFYVITASNDDTELLQSLLGKYVYVYDNNDIFTAKSQITSFDSAQIKCMTGLITDDGIISSGSSFKIFDR